MAFILELSESLSRGVIRIIQELVTEISIEMADDRFDLDDRIHNTRTNIKKCRAMLRLCKYVLPAEVYKQENVFFRDLGRLLSDTRDSFVMLETLEQLNEKYADELDIQIYSDIYNKLNKSYQSHLLDFDNNNNGDIIIRGMQQVYDRSRAWNIEKTSDLLILNGLEKVYKNGQEHMVIAFLRKNDHMMHEWRKEVKYIWYQLTVLSVFNTVKLDVLAERFHMLSSYLGLDHDLLELRQLLLRGKYLEAITDKTLFSVIDKEKTSLQNLANEKGMDLFALESDMFKSKIVKYFENEK